MNISENIKYIFNIPDQWELYTNKSYIARIQRSDVNREYNVPGKKGIVYNFFEDAYEKVSENGYIITGTEGEMWPIGVGSLGKYDIDPEKITFEPQSVRTMETDTVYAGICIPSELIFTLETNYGEKALLKGNRPEIGHGAGDFVLVAAKNNDGKYVPDFSDSGRIVNGIVFHKLYKKWSI